MERTEGNRAIRKEMLRFVRHVSAGDVRLVAAGRGKITAQRSRTAARTFEDAVVREALSRGLIRRSGETCTLDPAGRDWLKRALVGDDAASFAAQHRDEERQTVDIDGISSPVTRNLAESPLAALMRMKSRDGQPFLQADAFNAGERLRADFTRGQLQPRVSANWEMSFVAERNRSANGTAEISDVALAARQRVERALDAVGPELSGVLVDVCCFLKGLETVERERQWPVRSGKLMLKTALFALARHYAPPPRHETRRATHRWGAQDYKPEMAVRRP